MELRDRYTAFIDANEVPWELTMGALAIAWLGLGFVPEEASSHAGIIAVETTLWVVFAAEFLTRLLAARDRRHYLRGHWIDAVALLPTVRGVRLLRLLRLLRLVRAFAGIYRAVSRVERLAQHRGFAAIVIAWLTVMALCSAWVYAAENGTNDLFASPFDAVWWGVSTITTVGYGDTYPTTPEGRVGAMALMVLGIALFSTVTATITSFLSSYRESPRPRPPVVSELERLTALRSAGALTESEFSQAKSLVLATGYLGESPPT